MILKPATLLLSLCAFFTPIQAQDGTAPKPTAMKPFAVDKPRLQRQASMINLWWTSAERKAMPIEEAMKLRSKDIDDVYAKIELERRSEYAKIAVVVRNTKRCCSTPGRRRECPMDVAPPKNMRFDVRTLKNIDDDFEKTPSVQPAGNVTYTVKKTGDGCNTAGFEAEAVFTDDYINNQVKAEVDQVRAIFEPLVTIGINVITK